MSIYTTIAKGSSSDMKLNVSSKNKMELVSTPPLEFGGLDTEWSPEDFFSASISTCFILTFKAYARAKKMDWESIEVTVNANLEKTNDGLKFTKVDILPRLTVCCEKSVDPYLEMLINAKNKCLVTNSMNCDFEVKPKIILKAKK